MNWIGTLLTVNLIGIGSNFDNCGTGIAYGSDRVPFPHWVNAIVNGIGFGTALLGAFLGKVISQFITVEEAEWAACVVLVCIGLFFWYSRYAHHLVFPRREQLQVAPPGWRQGIMLGFALSFTNVAVGFGATVAHTEIMWITAASIAVWGFLMIWLGHVVGTGIIARWLGRYSSFISGLMLILVGLHQVFGAGGL